jgi:hypothetical protein
MPSTMLPNDFSRLKIKDERLRQPLQRIQQWIEGHTHATFLDPHRLTIELGDLAVEDLSDALEFLVARRILSIRYKAISPYNHALVDGDFESPLAVDEELYDTSENRFNKKDAEIIPVFIGTPAQ